MHRAVTTKAQAEKLVEYLTGLPLPFTVTVKEGEVIRGLSANALLHVWFAEIAKHRGDMSAADVKGECHQRWALTIRLRDPQFAWIWERTGALLDDEKQRKFLVSEQLAISSAMTPKELKEYMDEIEREFAPHVRLTQPEERT